MELPEFEIWLRIVCFNSPTPEAYDLAKAAWREATKRAIRKKESSSKLKDQLIGSLPRQ